MRLLVGLLLVLISSVWLIGRTALPPRRGRGAQAPLRRYPHYGWLALLLLMTLELALLVGHIAWIATYFTALVWTAYIVAVDGGVYRLAGRSLLHRPDRFIALALLSIPAWLFFEGYNLRLGNWIYSGVPSQYGQFLFGGSWAFATIFPAIFETAELIYFSGWAARRSRPLRVRASLRWGVAALGALLLLIPLLVSTRVAPFLFGMVWVGVVLLLDPVQYRLGWPSLWHDLEQGRPGRLLALLAAGLVCGFFWEFWNYWAAAKWIYVFPILQRAKIFEMPAPGFLGFPPFALECYAQAVVLSALLLPRPLRPRLLQD